MLADRRCRRTSGCSGLACSSPSGRNGARSGARLGRDPVRAWPPPRSGGRGGPRGRRRGCGARTGWWLRAPSCPTASWRPAFSRRCSGTSGRHGLRAAHRRRGVRIRSGRRWLGLASAGRDRHGLLRPVPLAPPAAARRARGRPSTRPRSLPRLLVVLALAVAAAPRAGAGSSAPASSARTRGAATAAPASRWRDPRAAADPISRSA